MNEVIFKPMAPFRQLYKTDKQYVVSYGGSGSGKSYAFADYVLFHLLTGPARWIVARKTAAALKQSVFALLINRINYYGLDSFFKPRYTDYTIASPNGDIVCVGLDDVNKLKSIYDPTDAWMEEADQCSQGDFEEIDRRIRTVTERKKNFFLSFNPTSAFSWLKDYFFDHDYLSGDTLKIKTTYKDNPFLDKGYGKKIELLQRTNPSAYRVYGLGEWGILEGLVFEAWESGALLEGARFLGYGLDFGFSNDPSALVGVWENSDCYFLKEYIYETGLTNPDLSAAMHRAGIDPQEEIIADSAEPKSIEELYRLGWNVQPAYKGPDSIRAGIDKMKTKKIVLVDSANLEKECATYAWAKDKEGRATGKPVDWMNHGIDAARYRINQTRREPMARWI